MNIQNKLLAIVIAVVAGFTGIMSSCTDASFTPPFTYYAKPFYEIAIYQLQLDYYNNVSAADAIYNGKRYYFGLVRAEQTTSIFAVHGSEDYVLAGNVKFVAHSSFDMKGIIQGTVFEVIGDIAGVQSGYIIVKNCWFRIQSGGAATSAGGAY